ARAREAEHENRLGEVAAYCSARQRRPGVACEELAAQRKQGVHRLALVLASANLLRQLALAVDKVLPRLRVARGTLAQPAALQLGIPAEVRSGIELLERLRVRAGARVVVGAQQAHLLGRGGGLGLR